MASNSTATVPVPARAISRRATGVLLGCGLVAGPLWVAVVLVQMITRPGFDIRRHAVSQLTLGSFGWVQMANFIVSGLLVVAFAVGIRRTLGGGRGSTWGPLLVAIYGVGLIGAGVFAADPGNGFPPGTPDAPVQLSSHGAMHLLFASIAFLSLIVASGVVFARRFRALGQTRRMMHSIATGTYFLITWVALAASGARFAAINVAFAIAVLLGWTWLTLLAAQLVHARAGSPSAG